MSSWAEQYAAKKAARLSEEKSKLNRNIGFGFSDSLAGNCGPIGSSESGADIEPEIIKVLGNEVKVESDKIEEQHEEQPIFQEKPEEYKAGSDSVIPKDITKDKCSKTPDSASPDPWYSTYEAKKAEALEHLKSGNLQSVAGASGFVGKIEGVEHLSKQNEVTRLLNRFKQEESKNVKSVDITSDKRSNTGDTNKPNTKTDTQLMSKTAICQPSFVSCKVSSSAYSSKPPPPPRQLVQQAMPGTWTEEPSSPPSNRPSRPSVPTPGKYGTLYGGAPSPGPNPSRSFQPPGFVPPTPPANLARRPAVPDSLKTTTATDSKEEILSGKDKKDSFQSMVRSVRADSKLSTSSWQEEYLARKKARLENC